MCWGIRYFGCLGLRDAKYGRGMEKTHRPQDNSIGKKRLRDRLSASIMKWWRRERRGRSR